MVSGPEALYSHWKWPQCSPSWWEQIKGIWWGRCIQVRAKASGLCTSNWQRRTTLFHHNPYRRDMSASKPPSCMDWWYLAVDNLPIWYQRYRKCFYSSMWCISSFRCRVPTGQVELDAYRGREMGCWKQCLFICFLGVHFYRTVTQQGGCADVPENQGYW